MRTFSEKTIAFLMENRFHNSRDWFLEHKQEYREFVIEPFEDFVAALSPTMLEIDGLLVTEPKVDKTISRIYRDTRFSHDKSLYKEHMWCVFTRNKKLYHGPPSFFFEITPDYFHYGCGYYQASGPEMAAMRELMLENHAAFRAMLAMAETQSEFSVEGDLYKRSKFPEQPEDLRQWLDRKNLFFTHRSTDFALLYSDKLAERVAAGFCTLKPAYEFFLATHARMQR